MKEIKDCQLEQNYYQNNGYYIFRQLIPHDLIDNLLDKYKSDILSSQDYFFRQSSNVWEKNKISEYGYSIESFRDPHYYPKYPDFSQALLKIICSQIVRQALTKLTGSPEHNVMQSMLFDLNAATPVHQDWYYLDSIPNGFLLAGWFALEDIHEKAGRFYVLPSSNKVKFELTDDEKISNGSYHRKLQEYLKTHQQDMYVPALKKGDVLFWNSVTIHGSTQTLDPQYSRKSLTCHYLPSEYQFGNCLSSSPTQIEYFIYEGMKCKKVHPKFVNYSLKNKLITDMNQYLWYRPGLKRIFNVAKKFLKSNQT